MRRAKFISLETAAHIRIRVTRDSVNKTINVWGNCRYFIFLLFALILIALENIGDFGSMIMSGSDQPAKKSRTLVQENRAFQSEWEEAYFQIEENGKAKCLLCPIIINGVKSFNVKRHYKTHAGKYDVYQGESRKRKLECLKAERSKQGKMFLKKKEPEEVTITSYKISHLLASNMKPYSDGEITKQAIVLFTEDNCSPAIQQKAKKLQLSNDTVTRRVDCISQDLHEQLIHKSQDFSYYSLALDSTNDITDIEQLAVFIRGVMPDFKICEEFLTLRSIHGTTKGTDMFREFHATLQEAHLDPSKLYSLATDGCPAMLGKNLGLQGLVNKWRAEQNLDAVTWQHCIIHQESLVAKSLKMSNVTDIVISTVNWIRANALNHRKFKAFLTDIDADHGDLIMFTAVRWLSRAACLKRFYALLPEIKIFVEGKKDIPQLGNEHWVADLAFMVDITSHLSSLNRNLQGNNKLCHAWYGTVSGFIGKLCLWRKHLEEGVTTHFVTLSNHRQNGSFKTYDQVISTLIDGFKRRIEGMHHSVPLMNIFSNPMAVDAATAPDIFQMELLDLQSDIELRLLFQSNGLLEFWGAVPEEKYPNLIANASKNACMFGSTYVCEALFSKLVRIKSKYRNRLTDRHLKQLLCTASSTMKPRYDKLVKNQIQFQVSH